MGAADVRDLFVIVGASATAVYVLLRALGRWAFWYLERRERKNYLRKYKP